MNLFDLLNKQAGWFIIGARFGIITFQGNIAGGRLYRWCSAKIIAGKDHRGRSTGCSKFRCDAGYVRARN